VIKAGLRSILLSLAVAAPLAAMGPRPSTVEAQIQSAAAAWRAADVSASAAILEPLAWQDPRAAREWAAFLFVQGRYRDLEAFYGLSPAAGLKDDEARLWLARAQVGLAHFEPALTTLRALSVTARPLALALVAEAEAGSQKAWPGAWLEAISATAGTRLEASTCLIAAERAAQAGHAEAAERYYKQAEKADPSYTQVHGRLAGLYAASGRHKDERIRLERALRVDPDDAAARQRLNQVVNADPGLQAELKAAQKKAVERFLGRANPTVAEAVQGPGEPTVRVGLLESAPRFRMKLGGFYAVEGSGRTLPAQSAWEVRLAQGGGWELRALSPAVQSPLKFSRAVRLLPLEAGSTFGLFDVDAGAGYFWAGKEDRYYRGIAELRPQGATGMTLVNELGLEAYLLSVVPSEAPPYWPAAALQAQAVAARTDAWRALGRFKSKGYDLCPTVLCAVYSGVGAEDARSSHAVTSTAGQVLEDERGKLHPTYYMHHSGGHTQEPGEAWTEEKRAPLMSGVDAPDGAQVRGLFPLTPAGLLHYLDDLDGDMDVWARRSGSFRWTLRFDAEELDRWAGRRHKVTPIQAVLPLERSVGGYVRRANFVGLTATSVGSSDYLRSALKGMKSNLFYPELRLDAAGRLEAILLHGGGWGHGVGMAQAGARAQADAGRNARQILDAYFPHSRLKRRYP